MTYPWTFRDIERTVWHFRKGFFANCFKFSWSNTTLPWALDLDPWSQGKSINSWCVSFETECSAKSQLKIKRVLLAEAQHRRLRSAFVWVRQRISKSVSARRRKTSRTRNRRTLVSPKCIQWWRKNVPHPTFFSQLFTTLGSWDMALGVLVNTLMKSWTIMW